MPKAQQETKRSVTEEQALRNTYDKAVGDLLLQMSLGGLYTSLDAGGYAQQDSDALLEAEDKVRELREKLGLRP